MPQDSPQPAVSVRGLRKQHTLGDTVIDALRGVDLDLAVGEFVAIVGPSGSGKSTLLHCVGGLDQPTAGSIEVAGTDISALDEERRTIFRRRNIGVIFQFFNLLADLTVAENVAVPLMLENVARKSVTERVDAALDAVKMSQRAKHHPSELSGGELQRVAIARALVIEPAVVLADEPTGNLDSANGERIIAELRRVADAYGRTVLMVTHDDSAAAQADRIVEIRDGLVVSS